jgi:hypothetical protein
MSSKSIADVLTRLARSIGWYGEHETSVSARPAPTKQDAERARVAARHLRARVRAMKLGDFSDAELIAMVRQGRR